MYNVVSDVEKYQEFVPWCVESIVTAKDDNGRPKKATIKVGWDIYDEEFESNLKHTSDCVIARSAGTSMFKELECKWTVTPITDTKTLAQLNLTYEFQRAIYNHISSKFGAYVCKKMIQAFSARAYDLEKKDCM